MKRNLGCGWVSLAALALGAGGACQRASAAPFDGSRPGSRGAEPGLERVAPPPPAPPPAPSPFRLAAPTNLRALTLGLCVGLFASLAPSCGPGLAHGRPSVHGRVP